MSGTASDEAWCIRCNRFLLADEFYKSRNPNHTRGVLPYCKECCRKIFKERLDEYKTLQSAMYFTCAELGLPFITVVYERTIEDIEERAKKAKGKSGRKPNYIGWYISFLFSLRTKKDMWDNFSYTDTPLDKIITVEERKKLISEEVSKFKLDWGEFETPEEYAFLEYRYDIYTKGLSLKPAQETLYRKLCIAELRARDIESEGDSTKEIQKQILDLMAKLKIDNFAENNEGDITERLLEKQIQLHEKSKPMEFYEQEDLYKDACGLMNGWDEIKRGLYNYVLGHKDYPKVVGDKFE